MLKTKRKISVSKAKKKAWDVFSKYIRLRDTTRLGTFCYTCEKYFDFKKMHAGHYLAGHRAINYFNEINCHAQCPGCNIYKHGDPITYREHLVRDYGEEIVKELEAHRNDFKQWKVYELEELYLKYKSKLKDYE
jgi:hypothetical protein